MKKLAALAAIVSVNGLTSALAQIAPAAAVAPAYSSANTTIGELLGNPATKAIIDKHIPGLSENPSIAMASGMTLRAVQPMAGDQITEKMLDAIDADLAAVKAR